MCYSCDTNPTTTMVYKNGHHSPLGRLIAGARDAVRGHKPGRFREIMREIGNRLPRGVRAEFGRQG